MKNQQVAEEGSPFMQTPICSFFCDKPIITSFVTLFVF